MKLHATKTQIITAAAVLLLLSGFTTVFAYTTNPGQPASTTSSSSSSINPTVSKSTSTSTSTTPAASTTSTTTSVSSTATTSTTITVCPLTAAACLPPCQNYFDLKLNPVPIPTAPTSYKFGTGRALLSIKGDAIYLTATISKAMPLTQYSITLNINGVSHLLATMVTDQNGNGEVTAQILLKGGVYAVSVQVFDTTNFATPTLSLQSVSVTITLPPVSPTPFVCLPIVVPLSDQAT